MNDETIEAVQRLEQAETNEEILLAVKSLDGTQQMPENYAVISAAGAMLVDNINE
jgi:VCBS repeat-containing protein